MPSEHSPERPRGCGLKTGATALALLVLAACGASQKEAAHHRARVEARAAHEAGRYAEAVEKYREACQLDVEDADACRMGRELAGWVVARGVAAARRPCAAADVSGCAAALVDARRVEPDDRRVIALLDRAGRDHLARCVAGAATAPEGRLAELACARSAQEAIATPSYMAAVSELGRSVAATLLGAARAPDAAAEPGAELVYAELAACASDDAQSVAEYQRARDRLVAARAVPLALAVQARGVQVGSGDLCARVESGFGGRTRCAAEGVPVRVGIDATPLSHTSSSYLREASYQAGVDRSVNPAYPAAERRLRDAERARRRLETERELRSLECERAERRRRDAGYCYDCPEKTAEEDACEAAESIDELYQQRVAEEDSARSELNSTAEIIETPIYATEQYQVTDHRWSLQYSIDLRIGEAPPRAVSSELQFTDSSHPGAPSAGVAPDPVAAPSHADVAGHLGQAAYNQAVHYVDAYLRQLAAERADHCSGGAQWSAAWLGCWAEVRLWAGDERTAASLVPGLRCAGG